MTVAGLQDHRSERRRRRLGTIDDLREIIPLARNSLYDAARYGRMPGVVRVGRRVLFDLDVVDAWIASGGGSPE